MDISQSEYKKYCNRHAKKSPLAKNCVAAFISGGIICAFAEGLYHIFLSVGITGENVKTLVPVTLIFIAALTTAIGVFDNAAKWAGAGTLVPITGFANAVVAPAIDNKSEGFIMGVGAKMFVIAGLS